MSEKWYKQIGDKKNWTKHLICPACKKETDHEIQAIFLGTLDLPIFEYRTVCSNCGATRRLPREPK